MSHTDEQLIGMTAATAKLYLLAALDAAEQQAIQSIRATFQQARTSGLVNDLGGDEPFKALIAMMTAHPDPKVKSAGEKEVQQAAPDLGPSRRAHDVPGPKIQDARPPAQPGAVHIGRAWSGHEIEDACPCPQEPCGLVDAGRIAAGCPQHGPGSNKIIRRSHTASGCQALRTWTRQELIEAGDGEHLDEPA